MSQRCFKYSDVIYSIVFKKRPEAREACYPTHNPNENVSKLKERVCSDGLDAHKRTFMDQLKVLLSDRNNIPLSLNLYPINARLSIVERLTASDEELSTNREDPFHQIADYRDYQGQIFPQLIGDSPTDSLKANEDVVNAYILYRMGIEVSAEL